jgi:hypothetical protein
VKIERHQMNQPLIPNYKIGGVTSAVNMPACPFCGCLPHQGGLGQCPNVAKIEYYPDGSIKSVEKR